MVLCLTLWHFSSFCVRVRTCCLKCDESPSSQTPETVSYYMSAEVLHIQFTSKKARRIQYGIFSCLDEHCDVSWPFVLSVLFLIHTLSDCLHGFIFLLQRAYREGGTCLLQWHCSCWLKLVIRLWERWKGIRQVKTRLNQRWNCLGNSFFVIHWKETKAAGVIRHWAKLESAENFWLYSCSI